MKVFKYKIINSLTIIVLILLCLIYEILQIKVKSLEITAINWEKHNENPFTTSRYLKDMTKENNIEVCNIKQDLETINIKIKYTGPFHRIGDTLNGITKEYSLANIENFILKEKIIEFNLILNK